MQRLGLVDIAGGEIVLKRDYLQAKRIYPPVRHGEGCITPVVSRLFVATRSTMNIQVCTSHGTVRYVVKYIVKVDENNYIAFSAPYGQKNGELVAEKVFLHNTKIASSAFNKQK